VESLTVTSKSFASNGTIPVDYTCDGIDKSPPLTWSAPPAGTRSLAVVVDDPDAPGGDFTHWLVFGLRPDSLAIGEAVDPAALGAFSGMNGFNRIGYSGPCPPRMELHHYYFNVFALDSPLEAKPGAARDIVDSAMAGHVLAKGTLVGTFAH
jgi:Raf kinase inhibitor-like YbhB/YbcL family protein